MTNRPKGKLFALLAIFVAIGMVTATGAFTSVTAERTVSVTTASDSGASYLQFTVYPNTASTLAETNNNGELRFATSGLNQNASTDFGVEFNVTYPDTNNQDIWFYIADEDGEKHAAIEETTVNDNTLEFTNTTGTNIEGQTSRMRLSPGEGFNVSISVNTISSSGTASISGGTILFIANTTT